ncbi:REP-associated tyrosine transposase [Pseudomonas entomophila]|uniref:REP-associated tyrosine transposase n=1 Tax=Pseudomonas entomophila TaxID=312306 RepID=UPI003EBC1FE7
MERPHSERLRAGRFSQTNGIYLLTTTTLGRQPLLVDWSAARAVVTCLRQAQAEGRACSLAWVIMPDHLHWLVQLGPVSLATLMRQVKSRNALHLNRCLGRTGAVWQTGFHDRALRREEDLKAVARYIVMNPVRAGLTRRVGDYPHWDAVWL